MKIKLKQIPIVIYLDDTPVRVSEINFPSVTICPGLCPIVDGFDYKPIITGIKSGELELKNFTMKEYDAIFVNNYLLMEVVFITVWNTFNSLVWSQETIFCQNSKSKSQRQI